MRRLPLFLDRRDALALVGLLEHVTRDIASWNVLAYCFMPNHMHLVVDADVDQLSVAMHRVNGLYAQRFNRVHGFTGHLFQGRYHAKPIRDEAHLPSSIRYVVMNPVRAGLCKRPESWRWSSYRATLGIAPAPPFLDIARALSCFGTHDAHSRDRLRRFVEAELPHVAEPGDSPGDCPHPEARPGLAEAVGAGVALGEDPHE